MVKRKPQRSGLEPPSPKKACLIPKQSLNLFNFNTFETPNASNSTFDYHIIPTESSNLFDFGSETLESNNSTFLFTPSEGDNITTAKTLNTNRKTDSTPNFSIHAPKLLNVENLSNPSSQQQGQFPYQFIDETPTTNFISVPSGHQYNLDDQISKQNVNKLIVDRVKQFLVNIKQL